jgi:hypothetical protein
VFRSNKRHCRIDFKLNFNFRPVPHVSFPLPPRPAYQMPFFNLLPRAAYHCSLRPPDTPHAAAPPSSRTPCCAKPRAAPVSSSPPPVVSLPPPFSPGQSRAARLAVLADYREPPPFHFFLTSPLPQSVVPTALGLLPSPPSLRSQASILDQAWSCRCSSSLFTVNEIGYSSTMIKGNPNHSRRV